MARAQAVTEPRPITVAITGIDTTANFIGAVKELIQRFEFAYAKDSTIADLTAVETFITGNIPFEGYAVTVTTDLAAGSYTVDYVETRPNAVNDID